MIKEIQESLTTNVKERLSSPILGTFSLLLAAFHWRFIVHLIWHDSKGLQLISELEKFRPYGFHSYFWPGFFTMMFTLGYPFLKLIYALFLSRLRVYQEEREFNIYQRELKLQESKLSLEKRSRDLALFIQAEDTRLRKSIEDGNIPSDMLNYLHDQFGRSIDKKFQRY